MKRKGVIPVERETAICERVLTALCFLRRADDAAFLGALGEVGAVLDGRVVNWTTRARLVLEGLVNDLQKARG